ncbi:M1-specific T cell receptor beta chain-like [Betta splendens]|uniref:M1-specific T cell receptor beta chain-like n=1 Tax=Betta splendens TaxID=158456 RepID=UPI00244E5B88|nr:M1-specific T cell receptor beta chain-like [Betta splendens]
MTPGVAALTFFLLWAAGASQSVLITQWPRYISSLPNDSVEMQCYQNDTDYEYLYWYRQLRGRGLQLMVTIVVGTVTIEEEFKSGFKAARSATERWSLTISSVQQKDEAVYLCAASPHTTRRNAVSSQTEAHFGAGTKLTVLDPKRNITAPQVAVFPPSPKECQRQKHINKTLVCVARRFYPDHVTVSWEVDLKVRSAVVTTDSKALMDGDYYTLSSRLTVPATDWGTAGRNFTCIVSFFDGTQTVTVSDSVFGEKIKKGTISRRRYEKITQGAKLSYGVLTAKSCVYGAFVALLLWRLQRLAGKQIDGEVN